MIAPPAVEFWVWGSVMAGTTFNAHPKNISDLLGGGETAKIVVPEFQRGYSWSEKEVRAFWEDIIQFQKDVEKPEASPKHFLGPIVLRTKSETEISLLDGQQRLATATILFSVIRDIASNLESPDAKKFADGTQEELIAKEGGGYALVLGETDRAFFRQTIQDPNPSPTKPKIATHQNILDAQKFLKEKIGALASHSNPIGALIVLRELRRTIRSRLVMAAIPVETEREAFKIFETLNDRGLRLSAPDLLLNFLMREADPESDRKDIRLHWTSMIEGMGLHDVGEFLRHFWVSKHGDVKATGLFTVLKEHITSKEIRSLNFAKDCAEECERYVELITFDETCFTPEAVKNLRVLKELGVNAVLPLLLSAHIKLAKPEFEKLTQLLLVFVTQYSIIAGYDSAGLETICFELAREVRASDTSDKKAVTACMSKIQSTLAGAAPTSDVIRSGMKSLKLRPGEAKYVIGRLATYMQSERKEFAVVVNKSNIEHVFPKKPDVEEWGGADNVAEMMPLLWHVGNLTILGKKLNSRLKNRGFEFKKPHYEKESETVMAQTMASHYDTWNAANIQKRGEYLADIVLQVWNFTNTKNV